MQVQSNAMQHYECLTILSILVLSLMIVNVRIDSVHATTTTTFRVSADTWINERSPSDHYPINWILEVAVFNTGGSQERERALLRFDISSIPAGSQILSATLSLFFYDSISSSTASPSGRTYWAYRLTQTAWDENLSNWNTYDGTNDWTAAGGDYTTKDGASAIVPRYFSWMGWTVTKQVETQYSSGSGIANFIIKDGTESVGYRSSIGCDFISKESVTSDNPSESLAPILTVEYTTYSATINAFCNTEGIDVSVPIIEDGSATDCTTPNTFIGLSGSHTFTVPGTDNTGHPFLQWSNGQTSLTLTVSSAGTYTAYYQVPSSQVHDIAITNLTCSRTSVGQGCLLPVDLTVVNLGIYLETFNITGYANQTISVQLSVTLPSGNSTTITTLWNTTGIAFGNYTISAYASPVQGETDESDNNFTGGVVTVTIPGDINGDFKVTLTDLVLLANAYGSRLGDNKWNPNADINGNGVVDLSDLVLLANHYGQQYS